MSARTFTQLPDYELSQYAGIYLITAVLDGEL